MQQSWNLLKYTQQDHLGSGGQGSVYKAMREVDNKPFAMKVVKAATEEAHRSNVREVQNMLNLNHKNVVPCVDYYAKKKQLGQDPVVMEWQLHIVMPLYKGDLQALIEKEGPLSKNAAAKLLHEMAEALTYLHDKGVIHRDVKPQNIMLTSSDPTAQFILADLGVSKTVTSADSIVGTPAFMAPDYEHGPYSNKVDMWALGATVCYAVLNEELRDRFLRYLRVNRDLVMRELRATLPRLIGEQLSELVLRLFSINPSERPTSEEVLILTSPEPPQNVESRTSIVLAALATVGGEERSKMITIAVGAGVDKVKTAAELEYGVGIRRMEVFNNDLAMFVDADSRTVFQNKGKVRVFLVDTEGRQQDQIEIRHDRLGSLESMEEPPPCLVIDFTGVALVDMNAEHVALVENFESVKLKGVIGNVADRFLNMSSTAQLKHLSIELVSSIRIGKKFLYRCESLLTVTFTGTGCVTSLGNDAFLECSALQNVDLSRFGGVTAIREGFLRECQSLRTLDLSVFANVTSIGNDFLSGCRDLDVVSFRVFSKVTKICNRFMRRCETIQSIDFNGFTNVITIGDGFLEECKELESVNLSAFGKVINIGGTFMSKCSCLQTIDLSAFANLTAVSPYFLWGCERLHNVDISGFNKVAEINSNFLYECRSLCNVEMGSFKNVTRIDDHFLARCEMLQTIDLSALTKVANVGHNFLADCESLREVDLKVLGRITKIDKSWLSGCKRLQSVDLSGFTEVTRIDEYFLRSCEALQSVDLSSLTNVTVIGRGFLERCDSMREVDLRAFTNVTIVDDSFLEACINLKRVDLRAFTNVTAVGSRFLSECTALSAVDLGPLGRVTQIGYSFLSGCTALKVVDLRGLEKVTKIGSHLLDDCAGLQAIDVNTNFSLDDFPSSLIGVVRVASS